MRLARPTLPDALNDRAQDNWDGLLAIASCAGAEWLSRATAAALKLSGTGEKTVSIGNELLADIKHVFESKKQDRISTADLIAALIADDEKSWATHNRGKPVSGNQITNPFVKVRNILNNKRCHQSQLTKRQWRGNLGRKMLFWVGIAGNG